MTERDDEKSIRGDDVRWETEKLVEGEDSPGEPRQPDPPPESDDRD